MEHTFLLILVSDYFSVTGMHYIYLIEFCPTFLCKILLFLPVITPLMDVTNMKWRMNENIFLLIQLVLIAYCKFWYIFISYIT